MANFSLGKPITIGGQEIVVVRDVLGSLQDEKSSVTYSVVEPKGIDGRPAIYVSEDDLEKLRDDYPGIKVYGLWQLLFFNNVVQLGEPLALFPLEEKRGLYLLMKDGAASNLPGDIASSGEYVNGFIPGQFELDMRKSNVIDVDLKELRLPPQPAYTRAELAQKLRAENKRRWFVVGMLCGLFVIGAAAANYGLQTIYKSRMADYSTKRSLIDELAGRVRALSAERLIKRPDDSVMLSQLYKVFDLYPMAVTPAVKDDEKIGFTAQHILVTPKKAPVDPAVVIPGLETHLQPDLSYRVVVGPPDEGDQSLLDEGSLK
ncbi:hypothetical protein [Pseudomonas putida]|uniref:Transmembrane protein n=1 Tax=Pseudomonas putida TaxID=303 RepID=A0A7V8J493_PSEPU|nr:hypothetical protein [Pseudomonas putida]KAF0254342.1 hypothetical protein GN299_13900 [Pseudomonas putida]